jgi:hypothetical protein
MAVQVITQTYQQFTDLNGKPLDSGNVYIGTAGSEAKANQITVYWDSALTQAVTQPIDVKGGYLNNSGTIGNVYTAATDFSISVRDKNDTVVSTDNNKRSIQPLQFSYNGGPEILTSTADGAVSIRRGSAADTDSVLVLKNNAATVVFNARADNKVGFGMGTSTPAGNIHIRTGGAIGSVVADGDELVLENSNLAGDNVGMTLLSGTTGVCLVAFGDTDDTDNGSIAYSNADQNMRFVTDASTNFIIKSDGTLNAANLPTSSAGLVAGDIWSNSGVLTLV